MIQIKDHLMPQRCIGGVLNPDDESLLSHHENLTIFQQDRAQFHATRQTHILSMCNDGCCSLSWRTDPVRFSLSIYGKNCWWSWIQVERSKSKSPNDLVAVEEFKMMPRVRLRRFIRSMHYRCDAVIDSGGGYTRY